MGRTRGAKNVKGHGAGGRRSGAGRKKKRPASQSTPNPAPQSTPNPVAQGTPIIPSASGSVASQSASASIRVNLCQIQSLTADQQFQRDQEEAAAGISVHIEYADEEPPLGGVVEAYITKVVEQAKGVNSDLRKQPPPAGRKCLERSGGGTFSSERFTGGDGDSSHVIERMDPMAKDSGWSRP